MDIKKIKTELKDVQTRIARYQQRVEDTPKREQELLSLKRDYDNLKGIYNSMLNRKLEAEIAVSMEKKQQGEQFRVIDPAKIPVRPIKPKAANIIAIALFVGIGFGSGLAYLIEMMDTSYKTPDEIEQDLQIPLLLSIPFRFTEQELKRKKTLEILKAGWVTIGFGVAAAGIVLATKGINGTFEYFKNFIDKI